MKVTFTAREVFKRGLAILPLMAALVLPAQAAAYGGNEIFVMNADGTNRVNVNSSARLDHEPSWSPGGSMIAFKGEASEGGDIWVMNADGSGQTNLTDGVPFGSKSGYGKPIAWSPQGDRIAFSNEGNWWEGGSRIYVMNADGSGLTLLAGALSGNNFGPAWSPNGSKILFTNRPDCCSEDIYVMNANGSGLTNLTDNPAADATGGEDKDPAWSPDGSKIVFTSNRDDFYGGDIYVMNADGSNPINLTPGLTSGYDGEPAWSPDGTSIAFSSCPDWGDCNLYVMDANGSNRVNLTNSSLISGIQARWSPQGARIAYAESGHIHAINDDGSNLVDLGSGYEPDWSPDASRIAFEELRVCSGNAPDLSLSRAQVFWASYGDYTQGILSVNYVIANAAGGEDAGYVTIEDSTGTNAVTVWTPLPLPVDGIDAGHSAMTALRYNIPAGVSSFIATTHARAADGCGVFYTYPGGNPEPLPE
ncbi:MAG: hypothetical protein M1455_00525 [Actinobacteria bacterium]|nr:hypothetical protein [Actinomycetota bacterium]